MNYIIRPEMKMETKQFDVVVCGGGTGGVFAAIAAARTGAKTALIENKGYVGGIAAEGGCGLHSFFNLWKAFPGTEKRKVVRGIPEEFIDRLTAINGCSGHNETLLYYDYDSDALCVDVESYKYLAMKMLLEAGVAVMLNTMMTDTILESTKLESTKIKGVIVSSHQGSEAILGHTFIDATGFGDLSARAGAAYTEPNDHPVVNSMGVAGIDITKYHDVLKEHGALKEYARGPRSGELNQIIRVDGDWSKISAELAEKAREIGMSSVTTTIHDNYLMFIKINYQMPESPTNRDALTAAEFELRRRQRAAIDLLKQVIPGSEKAFIARSAPSVTIRRGRCIACDYDISNDEVTNGIHFEDEIFSYGFHDLAPQFQIKDGKTYGLPLRAIQVSKIDNLYAIGMMITSDHNAHMSTRNTVSCMAQGQAAGTAAALCAVGGLNTIRDLPYKKLYRLLKDNKVWFDNETPYTQE